MINFLTFIFISISLLFVGVGCSSYSKSCMDGVCTIKEGGQTRYEGDPTKIAAIHKKTADQQKAEEDLQRAYNAAPRRAAGEPITVGLISFKSQSAELQTFSQGYVNMVIEEGKKVGLEWYDVNQMNNAVNMAMSGNAPLTPGASLGRKIRILGGRADAIVYFHVGAKVKTGLMNGSSSKNGAALAQVTVPEFKGSITSSFNYKPEGFSFEGKSISDLAMAGVNSDGKSGTAEIKTKRNIESDRPAIREMVLKFKAMTEKMVTQLPSSKSVAEIEKSQRIPASDAQPKSLEEYKNKLKGLFGGDKKDD